MSAEPLVLVIHLELQAQHVPMRLEGGVLRNALFEKIVLNDPHKIMPCENCENEMQVTFWASALSMGHSQKS